VTLGADNKVYPHTSIGFPPQDFKYKGEPTEVVIGDGNVIRENCTIHRGTPGGGGATRIGDYAYLMVGAHVAHDCQVGDHVLLINGAALGGHVEVGERAVVGALSAVHQFCRVGPHAYIGGCSAVGKDALPFCITAGNRAVCYGINRIGLRRAGKPAETIAVLDAATRALFRAGASREEALAEVENRWGEVPEVKVIIDFVRGARRGVAPIRLNAEWAGE
jgi:UDP-N-acetylglucosamine acyltransferase